MIKKRDETDEFGMRECNFKDCNSLTTAFYCSICAEKNGMNIYYKPENQKKELNEH